MELSVRDGTKSIFLSTEGKNAEEVTGELVKFLEFVKEDKCDITQDYKDTFVKQLQDSIQRVKQNREMERQYMLLEDLLKEERKAEVIKIRREDIMEYLEELGEISEELYNRVMSETRVDILIHMFKDAVKADSLEEFEKSISNL